MIERRHLLPGVAAFLASTFVALLGLYAQAEEAPLSAPGSVERAVKLRLLGVNDFHGHLEPPQPGLGGAAWLKAHLDRSELPGRTIRVHAGDMVGASPLISGWFHDEPSIEAGNAIGFDVGTVGNHEFDEGGAELMRLLGGGRRAGPEALKRRAGPEALKRDASGRLVNTSSNRFGGADYPYLAANTVLPDGRTLLPPHMVVERAGVRIGFIGVTTPSTPRWLLPRHGEEFRFTDMSDAVNRSASRLRNQGVEAIVVLAHAGAPTPKGMDPAHADGEIVGEAWEMSDAVDVVVAGHSHSWLNLRVDGKLIVEARSYGTAFDVIDITVDRRSGEVVEKSAEVLDTRHGAVPADRELSTLVRHYAARVAPLAKKVVGHAQRPLSRGGPLLGPLAAEAQRELARADVAVVDDDCFRGDIDAGPVTHAEVAETLGYDHPLLRKSMMGRELSELLEGTKRGFYVAGTGDIDPRRRYTVVASEMLATGDALPALRDARGSARRVGTEIEALSQHLQRNRPRR